jgi:hypothetical protein
LFGTGLAQTNKIDTFLAAQVTEDSTFKSVSTVFGNRSEMEFFRFCNEEGLSHFSAKKLIKMVSAPDWNPSGWKSKSFKAMETKVLKESCRSETNCVNLHEGLYIRLTFFQFNVLVCC